MLMIYTNADLDSRSSASANVRKVTASLCCSEPSVLVVDDDPHFRELARSLLSSWGISAAEAESGLQALVYLRKHSAALQIVIVDVMMPDHDGLEVIREIRCSFPHTKLLAVSGVNAGDLYLQLSSLSGADAVLPKSRVELLPKLVRGMLRA